MGERYKNQIVFVSRENAAELEGALWPAREAARVHAIVTDEMREKGEALKAALESRGVRCETHRLPEIRQKAIEEVLERICAACEGESFALNLTGGTKLMTLAAYDWAYAVEMPAFYMDGSRLVHIQRGGWEEEPIPADILDYQLLLAVYGYTVLSKRDASIPAADRGLIEEILAIVAAPNGAKALSCLNGCAQTAMAKGEAGLPPEARDEVRDFPLWQQLLGACAAAGKLSLANGRIKFASLEAAKWCGGGWLEEYVQMILYRLEKDRQISSFACGVEVEDRVLLRADRQKGSGGKKTREAWVRNELDAIFTRANRLFVVECKTGRLGHNARSVLHKADSLNDRLGGTFTRSLLCSVYEPSSEKGAPFAVADATRAEELKITLVYGSRLANLKEELLKWSAPR